MGFFFSPFLHFQSFSASRSELSLLEVAYKWVLFFQSIWPPYIFWLEHLVLLLIFLLFFIFYFCFLGLHLGHMEVPRLGVEWKLQLLAYSTAIATSDLSYICNLHHSSQLHQILNPLSEARDRTQNLIAPSQICFHCTTTGTPEGKFLLLYLLSMNLRSQTQKKTTQ